MNRVQKLYTSIIRLCIKLNMTFLGCGVGKDNVKNLPRDLISLIEPEYCGICAQGLDSFAICK